MSWSGRAISLPRRIIRAQRHLIAIRKQAAQLWERPYDLSRVIDAVTTDSALAGKVEPGRIAAIGHSLGGWSVVALAGAQFDPARFDRDCTEQPNPRTCGLASELITPRGEVAAEKLKTMKADPRVGAIVSLDLGLARGFTPESLNSITIPALIFGAGVDIGDLPAKLESGYVATNMSAKPRNMLRLRMPCISASCRYARPVRQNLSRQKPRRWYCL